MVHVPIRADPTVVACGCCWCGNHAMCRRGLLVLEACHVQRGVSGVGSMPCAERGFLVLEACHVQKEGFSCCWFVLHHSGATGRVEVRSRHPGPNLCPAFLSSCSPSAPESVVVGPKGQLVMLDRYNQLWEATQEPQTGSWVLSPRPLVQLGPGRPLGYHFDHQGNLIICDSLKV